VTSLGHPQQGVPYVHRGGAAGRGIGLRGSTCSRLAVW
jgi:hypothetical protein